ncbi:hypothetical protein MIR68_012416 [Amoeboaphelidium protococcarum]|nr:hypothetical protein MIR68_012416 [Amoeboaphelidium protococcarum]
MRQSKITRYFTKASPSAKFLSPPKTYQQVEFIAHRSSPMSIGSAVNMARVVPGSGSPAPMKRTQNKRHIRSNSLDLYKEPLELTGDPTPKSPESGAHDEGVPIKLNLLAAQSKQ